MRIIFINDCLSDLLINISAGYFGLVLFSPFLKANMSSIFFNFANGIIVFMLGVKIKEYGSH